MADLTTSKKLDSPAMDFVQMYEEGIAEIGKLAGHLWTDHNAHDPGITILEQVCFSLLDLGFRLSFDMKDLLTPSEDDPQKEIKQFFTAAEILTCEPTTLRDYRKLLIDQPKIKNAWIEKIENSTPELYWDYKKEELTFTASDSSERVSLQGLYRVLLEVEIGYSREEVKKNVKKLLNQHRNLGEDFVEVIVLPVEKVRLSGEIELQEGVDQDAVMAEIHEKISDFLAPLVKMYSLEELQAEGKDSTDIYNGPVLNCGFLPNTKLTAMATQTELHVSDLIHIILDLPEVKVVRELKVTSKAKPTSEDWQEWALELSTGRVVRFQSLDSLLKEGNLKFYKRYNLCRINAKRVQDMVQEKQEGQSSIDSQIIFEDLEIPQGEYREIKNYRSVQYEFPTNYGIANKGLPPTATLERRGQAKQLQAYLLFFDQIMANFQEQMGYSKNLLAIGNNLEQTYFPQSLQKVPSSEELLYENYETDLLSATETIEIAQERKNRIYDHLLARFGEVFTDYSLLQLDSPSENLANKKFFLQNCAELGAKRAQAFNYTDHSKIWNTDNVGGLKRRLYALLGIQNVNRKTLHLGEEEGFHLIEHVLLRPYQNAVELTQFNYPITSFIENQNGGSFCVSERSSLSEGEQIIIFGADQYNGLHRVKQVKDDRFALDVPFDEEKIPKGGFWCRGSNYKDPYSLKVTYVFPNWIGRFVDDGFRKTVSDLLRRETPAHLACFVQWLEPSGMKLFEERYQSWLTQKTQNIDQAKIHQASLELLEQLR